MVNLVWFLLIGFGFLIAVLNNNVEVVTNAAFSATENGIKLIISITGILMLWLGILAILRESGLMDKLAKILMPLVHLLFPNLRKNHPAISPILMNMSANLLGLGNAATPFGLKAMEELAKDNPKKDTASDDMIMLLILNTSSITLIPATVVAIRQASGGSSPEEIILPTIFATLCGTIAGISLHKILAKRNKNNK